MDRIEIMDRETGKIIGMVPVSYCPDVLDEIRHIISAETNWKYALSYKNRFVPIRSSVYQ